MTTTLLMTVLSVSQVESVVTAVVDLFPDTLRVGRRREMLVGVVCLVDMAIGSTMVMQVSGEQWCGMKDESILLNMSTNPHIV